MKKLFIHIPKNGGVTIRESKIFQDKIVPVNKKWIEDYKYFKRTMESYGERDTKGVEHARWIDVNPNITSTHTAFAVVRNPWSKVVSRYLFAKQAIDRGLVNSSYAKTQSLDHFIEERYEWGLKPLTWYRAIRGWWPQKHHVKDNNNNVVCDILTLENLNTEAPKYLGVATMPRARNVTSIKYDYKELYNTKTIQEIADWYKEDIEYWNFDFDTGARRNTWIAKNTI